MWINIYNANIDIWGLVQSAVLFITFVAILWYALETRQMKKELVKQNKIEQKPILDFYYRPETDEHKKYLRIRNSGKGVAYNIEVGSIVIDNTTFNFYFDEPNAILAPLGDEKTLYIDVRIKKKVLGDSQLGAGQLDSFLNTISPPSILSKDDMHEANFIIQCENALKKKFYRIFRFYCDTPATDNFQIRFIKEGEGEYIK